MKKYLQKVNWIQKILFVLLVISVIFLSAYRINAQTPSPSPTPDPFAFFRQISTIMNVLTQPFGSTTNPPDFSSSNPSISPNPNSPTPNPYAATAVTQLVDSMTYSSQCEYGGNKGVASQHNPSCVDSTSQANLNPTAQKYLYECIDPKATNNEFLQCVCFARAATAMTTGNVIERVSRARDYISNPPNAYHFVNKKDPAVQNGTISPKTGDLLLWDFPSLGSANYGHIAYIVTVKGYSQNNNERYYYLDVAEANWGVRGKAQIEQNLSTDRVDIVGWLALN